VVFKILLEEDKKEIFKVGKLV